jgi:hypothetical protein
MHCGITCCRSSARVVVSDGPLKLSLNKSVTRGPAQNNSTSYRALVASDHLQHSASMRVCAEVCAYVRAVATHRCVRAPPHVPVLSRQTTCLLPAGVLEFRLRARSPRKASKTALSPPSLPLSYARLRLSTILRTSPRPAARSSLSRKLPIVTCAWQWRRVTRKSCEECVDVRTCGSGGGGSGA